MQTLSEINREEQARRQRALRYEQLTNKATGLRTVIQRLEAAAGSAAVSLDALREINDLIPSLPKDVTTRQVGMIPGGFDVRQLLGALAADALQTLERKEQDRVTQLQQAGADLAKVEEALTEFA